MTSLDCDVLVVGGGPAGVAAAVAAGRTGARTVLLEKHGFLGGSATAGLAGTVCGLYLRDGAGLEPALVSGGFLAEFAARLAQASQAKPLRLEHGLWVLPFEPRDFEATVDALVSESGNVTQILHATLMDVWSEGTRVTRARGLGWNEPLAFLPRSVVDCTGEATAVALAGGATEDGSADQASALVFVMENVDPSFNDQGMIAVWRELRRAIEAGMLPSECERLSLVPAHQGTGRVALKLNLVPPPPGQPTWQQATARAREARALADRVSHCLAGSVAAFRHARFSHAASQVGVRSGRRIRGLTTLSQEAVLEGRKTADGIARGSWPAETWTTKPLPTLRCFAERDYYEVPFGCLRPAGLDNVWTAGRCLSAEAEALASARVIGTSMATGWAAGTLAAFQAAGKLPLDAVKMVRDQMCK